jgi:hypothetical protein
MGFVCVSTDLMTKEVPKAGRSVFVHPKLRMLLRMLSNGRKGRYLGTHFGHRVLHLRYRLRNEGPAEELGRVIALPNQSALLSCFDKTVRAYFIRLLARVKLRVHNLTLRARYRKDIVPKVSPLHLCRLISEQIKPAASSSHLRLVLPPLLAERLSCACSSLEEHEQMV